MKQGDLMKFGLMNKAQYNGPENTSLVMTGTNEGIRLQNRSMAYPRAAQMFSPVHRDRNKLNKVGNVYSKFKLKTPMKLNENAYNDRYTASKVSSRMSKHLATSLMKNSGVNSKIASDLHNTKPLISFKPQERKSSKPNEAFDNNGYLNAVKEQTGPKNWANQDLNNVKRDIASEIDYSDIRSASKSVRQSNRKNIKTPFGSQLTTNNLQKLETSSKIIKKGGGGSVYSDAMSHLSKYKQKIKEITEKAKTEGNLFNFIKFSC